MVKLFEGKKIDPKAIHESLQKGYRIKHPEQIAGYAGFFYNLGDVYASDAVFKRMEQFQEFKDFVLNALKNFEDGEYGDISQFDLDENIENRWLFGVPKLFGRYGFHPIGTRYREIIRIRQWNKITYIMYDSDHDAEMGIY